MIELTRRRKKKCLKSRQEGTKKDFLPERNSELDYIAKTALSSRTTQRNLFNRFFSHSLGGLTNAHRFNRQFTPSAGTRCRRTTITGSLVPRSTRCTGQVNYPPPPASDEEACERDFENAVTVFSQSAISPQLPSLSNLLIETLPATGPWGPFKRLPGATFDLIPRESIRNWTLALKHI